MGLSEKITEIAKNLQKVDNMILYQQLIDLSTQALELQSENAKLQNENADLKKELEIDVPA
jgi:regulator of replication initiation timing